MLASASMTDRTYDGRRTAIAHAITVTTLALTATALGAAGLGTVPMLAALALVGALAFVLHGPRGRLANPPDSKAFRGDAPPSAITTSLSSATARSSVVPTRATEPPLEHALLDVVPFALVAYDDRGRIVLANASARDLFLESGGATVGSSFLEILRNLPLPAREAFASTADTTFSVDIAGTNETFHLARRYLERDGATITMLVIRRLTRDIARHEVEVLKGVIRVISHELNNSLAPILSLAHSARTLARAPDPGEKLVRVFDTIDERARHLSGFLEGYARLARLPRPQPRDVEWAAWLSSLATLYPEMRVGAAPEARGWLDPVLVEQVVINLVKNAVEADSAASDVSLDVNEVDDGFELVVRDRGSGMDAEAMRNATLPFYTTKRTGTGLGLALCREIVEAHGGELHLAARDGGGTEVRVWLPGRGVPSRTARLTLSAVLST